MVLPLDDARTAEIALDQRWRELALNIEKAHAAKTAVAPGQPLPEDDEVYVSWLDTFQQELAAVQTVHDAAPRLKAEDLRAAVSTAERLLSVLDEAQANVRAKQARAAEEAEPPAGGVDAGAQDT